MVWIGLPLIILIHQTKVGQVQTLAFGVNRRVGEYNKYI